MDAAAIETEIASPLTTARCGVFTSEIVEPSTRM
jgi:hypothetical protein